MCTKEKGTAVARNVRRLVGGRRSRGDSLYSDEMLEYFIR